MSFTLTRTHGLGPTKFQQQDILFAHYKERAALMQQIAGPEDFLLHFLKNKY